MPLSQPNQLFIEDRALDTFEPSMQSASALQQSAKDQLKSFVERVERLEEEKAALASDIRDLFAQAKSTGFDTKALRAVIRLRKQEASERRDQEAILATYMLALGMLEAG